MRAAALVAFLVAVSAMSSCAAAPETSAPTVPTTPTATAAPGVTTSLPSVASVASSCAGAGTVEQVEAPFGAPGARLANVYLPACYVRDPERRFPVVFLLHGAGAGRDAVARGRSRVDG